MKSKKIKTTIGRLEKIDIPEFSLYSLDAKIDTGAYTSSLHCHHIETLKKDSRLWVRFHVLDPHHPEYEEKLFEYPVYTVRNVKSSNGLTEERVTIKLKVEFMGDTRMIELSLTNRTEMKYPILIGRKFLTGRYLVDVSRKYITP